MMMKQLTASRSALRSTQSLALRAPCWLRSQAKSPRQCVEDVHLSGPAALAMTRSSIGCRQRRERPRQL